MARLEIRLFGGFEIWHGDRPVTDFESQKVRALLAYLLLNRDSAHSRDHLAGLLWPEKDEHIARRNLRQALYNLRTTLPHGDSPTPPILTTHRAVRFNLDFDYWLDVEAFEHGIRLGMPGPRSVDPHHLAGAVELYRGDLLAGFFVSESPTFEHWLLYEQERLRELAIQALRRLVDHYLTAGAYSIGIRYAQRLLEIDPLLEEIHRKLMRLYALSGRRNRALAQYQECRRLLCTELGVEPLEETTELYQAILAEEWPVRVVPGPEPSSPSLPLVGRGRAYARLRRSWEAVCADAGQLVLVEGEVGIGKTWLVETFIQDVTSQTPTLVLRGRCYSSAPQVGHQPIAEALRWAIMEETQAVQRAMAAVSPHWLAEVARIVPELRALHPDLPEPSLDWKSGARQRLSEGVARFLEALTHPADEGQSATRLILFLDDLHWADDSTLDLVQHVIRRLAGIPVWIAIGYQPEALTPGHSLQHLWRELRRERFVERVVLERLKPKELEEIAAALVGATGAMELADFLDRMGARLPLTLAELVHFLCDEGHLVPREDNRWALIGSLPALAASAPGRLQDLILWRVTRLPASARRLLTLAAINGPQFDAQLLQQAAGEHMAVVDAGIEIWQERRLVRQVPWQRGDEFHEAETQSWASVARWRTFEFTHDIIRLAIFQDVHPSRREVMHRQIATALEARHAGDAHAVCEHLAHHYTAAKVWDKAVYYLQQAGEKACQALAPETALHYYDQALEVLNHLESGAGSAAEQARWQEKRLQILASRQEVVNILGYAAT